MLYDLRIYTCRPNTLKAQLELYEAHGFAVQKRHLGPPVLYGITESGALNTYVHVWAYKDAADRAQRRQNMEADPEWIAFRQKSGEAGYLVSQENRLLSPASFFEQR